jgi:hypothetical protein
MRSLYDELRSLTDAAELADKNGVLESAITLIQQLRQENHRLKIQKTCATAIPQATAPPPNQKFLSSRKNSFPPPTIKNKFLPLFCTLSRVLLRTGRAPDKCAFPLPLLPSAPGLPRTRVAIESSRRIIG